MYMYICLSRIFDGITHIYLGLGFVAKYYFLNSWSTTSLLVHWCWTLTRVHMYTWYVNNNWYVCVHVGREADWSEVAGTVGRGQTAFLWGVWGGEGRLRGAGQTLQEFTGLQEMDGGKATRCGVTYTHSHTLIPTHSQTVKFVAACESFFHEILGMPHPSIWFVY